MGTGILSRSPPMSKFCSDLCVCAPHSLPETEHNRKKNIRSSTSSWLPAKPADQNKTRQIRSTGKNCYASMEAGGKPRTCRWGLGWDRRCRAPRGSRWRSGGSAPTGVAARSRQRRPTAIRTRPQGGAEPSPSRVGVSLLGLRGRGRGGWEMGRTGAVELTGTLGERRVHCTEEAGNQGRFDGRISRVHSASGGGRWLIDCLAGKVGSDWLRFS